MCLILLTMRVRAPTGVFAECGQPSVLLIGGGGNVDLPQPTDRLALQQTGSVDPQQFAERRGVATIGLALLPFFGLDQDHFVAAVVLEHPDQPIVEAADFERGDERFVIAQSLAGESLKELVDLLGLRRNLPRQHNIAVFIAQRNGDLTCMLVNSEVQHNRGSPVVRERFTASPSDRRTASSQQDRLFHRYQRDAVAQEIEQSVRDRAGDLGLEIASVGSRDVILPGDMKDLMNKVTEAKKAAEANLIARREETAAMRSQANTAKLLADNPTLMRLRELEVLENVASTGKLNVVLGEKGLAERVVNLL